MTVRHEKVVLDLDDRFSRPMAQAAAAAALLNRELNDLSGSAVKTRASASGIDRDVTKMGTSADKSGKQIDKLSGRLALFAQAAAVLGPALMPIGAAAVPAIAGMAAQLTLAAGAAGVTVLAFKGLGEGIKTLNAYQLEPTAENLDKMRLAMEKLGPAGAEFARFLDSVGPQFRELRMSAREGMFPGMEEGITSLLALLPQVNRIVGEIAGAMGDLAAQAGAGLSGERFAAFFEYLESEARPILMEMGHTIGNFADGFTSMLVAFSPLTASFSSGLEGMSAAFADWAHSLESSDSFAAFVSYVQQSGPMVLDMLGSMVQMFVGIAEAAAPVGAVVVPALTILADTIAVIAKSDIGTPIFAGLAALSLLSRATAAYGGIAKTAFGGATIGSVKGLGAALTTVTTAQERATMSASALAKSEAARNASMREGLATFGKTAALMGGLTLATTGAAEGIGLANTASMALMGTMAGPWGAAIGGGVGLAMDLAHANDDLAASFTSLKVAMDSATPTPNSMAALDAQIESSRAKLAQFTSEMEEYSARGGSAIFQLLNPSQSIAGFKNEIEGLFGTSDVEEYVASLEAAEEKQATLAAQSSLTGASSSQLAQAMDQAAQAAFHEAEGIQSSTDAMRAKRSETLRAANAEINYEASIDDATAAAKENGRTLDITTEKGRANRSALLNMAGAWNGLSDSAKNTKGAHRQAIEAFVAVADQMGMGKKAAERYARSLMEIPPKRQTIIDLNTTVAMQRAAIMKAQLASIDRNIDIYINAHTTRLPSFGGMGPRIDSANGNMFAGDVANGHQPTILNGSVTRVWNEPETKGESYIPHANDARRPRAKSILEQTAGIFGGQVQWFATGGINGGLSTHNRSGMNFDPLGVAANRAVQGLHALAGMSAKELKARERLLERQIRQAEKEFDASKERLTELRAQLKALKDARKQFAEAVTQNFMSELFGNMDLVEAFRNNLVPSEERAKVYAFAESNGLSDKSYDEQTQAYLASLSTSQIAALQVQANTGVLDTDTREANTFADLLEQLRAMGLKGAAYQELAMSGNLAQAKAYASMTEEMIAQLNRDYRERAEANQALAAQVGNAEYGRAINRQTRAVENQIDEVRGLRQEMRDMNRLQRGIDKRLEQIEQHAPKKTGAAVAGALNGAVGAGNRKGLGG